MSAPSFCGHRPDFYTLRVATTGGTAAARNAGGNTATWPRTSIAPDLSASTTTTVPDLAVLSFEETVYHRVWREHHHLTTFPSCSTKGGRAAAGRVRSTCPYSDAGVRYRTGELPSSDERSGIDPDSISLLPASLRLNAAFDQVLQCGRHVESRAVAINVPFATGTFLPDIDKFEVRCFCFKSCLGIFRAVGLRCSPASKSPIAHDFELMNGVFVTYRTGLSGMFLLCLQPSKRRHRAVPSSGASYRWTTTVNQMNAWEPRNSRQTRRWPCRHRSRRYPGV